MMFNFLKAELSATSGDQCFFFFLFQPPFFLSRLGQDSVANVESTV